MNIEEWITMSEQELANHINYITLETYSDLIHLLNIAHFKDYYFVFSKYGSPVALFTPEKRIKLTFTSHGAEIVDPLIPFNEGLITLNELYSFLHSFYELRYLSLTGSRCPTLLLFENEIVPVQYWKPLLTDICQILKKKNEEALNQVLKAIPWISNEGDLNDQILENFYIEPQTNYGDYDSIIKTILNIFEELTNQEVNIRISFYQPEENE